MLQHLSTYLNKDKLFIYILIFLISYIITLNIGYDRNNIIFDTLILSLLLIISRINTISTFICLLFLTFCAIYAPIGNIYGVLTSEMVYAAFQTNTSEATEFIKLIPVKNICITLLILTFSIFFWIKRQKENSSKLILILFFSILFYSIQIIVGHPV